MPGVYCIGQAVQDFVFYANEIPARAAKYRASGFESVGGGPAATAAVAITRLGGTALLAARLGDDPIARIIVDELESYGVDCSGMRRFAGRSSSLSAVVVDAKGERLIMNYLDEHLEPETGWLPDTLPSGVDAVLADTRWPEGALHALTMAGEDAVPAVLDADVPVPRDGALLRAASHVAFSADGLSAYCGDADLEAALRRVNDETDAWCCVTVGSRGAMAIEDGSIRRFGAYSVEAKDTLGAGDVWHGAFALALAEKKSATEALQFAAAAAALKVKNGGGRSGTPTRDELEAFMSVSRMEHSA